MFSIILSAMAATAAQGDATPPADYSVDSHWLCLPGREDACSVNLDVTVIKAKGKTSVVEHKAAEDPAYDCFYVYPTLSEDPGGNSDLVAGEEEFSVVQGQFARFNSVCRTYAPVYRQITLAGLRGMMGGNPIPIDRALGYNDVRASFEYYMENWNDGRPFVLIGHSQGSSMLQLLINEKIDGKPLQDQMLSAMLIGWNTMVPEGEIVGGTFDTIPVCTEVGETGCLISYVSFRENVPPAQGGRFGRATGEGMEVVCTNPVSLERNKKKNLKEAYLTTEFAWEGAAEDQSEWVEGGAEIETAYVSVPGLLEGQCVNKDGAQYFEITVKGDPSDPRADDITGDIITPSGEIDAGWGLHLLDMSLGLSGLIDLAEAQAKTKMSE